MTPRREEDHVEYTTLKAINSINNTKAEFLQENLNFLRKTIQPNSEINIHDIIIIITHQVVHERFNKGRGGINNPNPQISGIAKAELK